MQLKEEAHDFVIDKYREKKNTTYFSSFILHIISSFQLTKIIATSFSVSSSDSISGFWKIYRFRKLSNLESIC